MNDIRLTVDGSIWRGWQSVTVQTGIEFLAGAFALDAGNKWAEDGPIGFDQPCALHLGETPLITGYVGKKTATFGNQTRDRSLMGWDRASDLSDCAVESASYRNQSLMGVLNTLCEPFGLTAVTDQDDIKQERLRRFDFLPGETGSEAIDRLSRQCAVLIFSNGLGQLQVVRGQPQNTHGTALEEGINIESAQLIEDRRLRFSHYSTLSQLAGFADEVTPLDRCTVSGDATDSGITRHRACVVLSESSLDRQQAVRRSQWQRAVCDSRSWRLSVRVKGWAGRNGELWKPWLKVPVKSPWLAIDETLLVAGCTYQAGKKGFFTTLELCKADAFDLNKAEVSQ
ncbi:phage baseplate assembly protein [Sansalvadorimonas verongulae]|uniref:phage baseplate assembly protein n=1 Tax=Sansalvadorimonas verongulae TaxID=2172824 RepID=UPI0012BCF4AB|nr:hypothetical protein [Sansalvadorimonas verongulae]MTI13368.1 hypothetical protein [Sansalvadorimonas verongulae]